MSDSDFLQRAYDYFQASRGRILSEYRTFLQFPSISTQPEHHDDCCRCASWLQEHLSGWGFAAELLETTGKPAVFAEFMKDTEAPTVLVYGHYDVQPVDPLELWESEPFTPTEKNGRIYARGAQDNKGQLFFILKAIEYLHQEGNLDCNLKLIIEGEEECGSAGMADAVYDWKEKLAADVLLVCDTVSPGKGRPSITLGLRGIVALRFRLAGSKTDLHSGTHGGVVVNPAVELARLLATLHDEQGKVAVPGFYSSVEEISADDRPIINASPIDIAAYEELIGVEPLGGEADYTPVERRGFRPAIDVNGVASGYAGPGLKTIIPAEATALISARLVMDQDPEEVLELIIKHLERHAPRGLRLEVLEKDTGGRALKISAKHPLVEKVRRVIAELRDQEPVLTWEGGSIPVVSELVKVSGAAPLLVGFGLEEDAIHAPNESFDLEQLEHGFAFISRLFSDRGNITGNEE